MLSRRAVLGFRCITAADEPAGGTEDLGVSEDGVITVDANQRNVDDLVLPDRDCLDPRAVNTADGMAETLREVLVVNFTFCGDFCGDFHYKSKSPQVLVVVFTIGLNHHNYLWRFSP